MYVGEREVYTGFLWGNRRKRDHWGNTEVDGRTVLRYNFKKLYVGRKDRIELAQEQVAGTCECGIELSGSIKCGEFLD